MTCSHRDAKRPRLDHAALDRVRSDRADVRHAAVERSSGLTAQVRYSTTDPWVSLPTKTSADFFNGIDAARFDYPASTAYISARFSHISDVIYVRLVDALQQEVPISYSRMPLYYDNRRSAATVSLDDWDWAAACALRSLSLAVWEAEFDRMPSRRRFGRNVRRILN